jgi:hypothetical protein
LGNAFADGLAGLPAEGVHAAMGVTAGCLLPLVPLLAVMLMRRPLVGASAWFVGGSSVTLLAATTWWNLHDDDDESDDACD